MTERNKRYLPIAAIAAVALVAAACSSGSDDAAPVRRHTGGQGGPAGTAMAFASVVLPAGTEPLPTYHLDRCLGRRFQAELEAYDGPADGYLTGDTVTIGGIHHHVRRGSLLGHGGA